MRVCSGTPHFVLDNDPVENDVGDSAADLPAFYREADVPEVTAHGQRGLHSTLAVEAGITARAVADALGHESFTTTARSYAKPEAIDRARQQRTLQVLQGGLGRGEVAA